MTRTQTGALIRIVGQVLFGTWVAALTLLFCVTQTPYAVSDAVVRSPRLAFLGDWHKAVGPRLSATYKQ